MVERKLKLNEVIFGRKYIPTKLPVQCEYLILILKHRLTQTPKDVKYKKNVFLHKNLVCVYPATTERWSLLFRNRKSKKHPQHSIADRNNCT